MSKSTFEEQAISTIFRLNGRSVFPALSPSIDFHHHSLPAWDEAGGPAIEQGLNIESNKTQIDTPTVLVSKLNPRKPRVAVANPLEGERHCASTEFMCFSPRDKNEDLRYWAYYFGSTEFATRLQRVAVGSTNSHTRANPTEVLTWAVPTPPSEQKRAIADVLDTLDTTIRQTEAIIAKLKQVKQGLLHDLLTRGIDANGELRPPQSEAPQLYKASPLGWIPSEWGIYTVGDIAESIVDGPFGSNLKTEHYVPSPGVRVVRLQNIDIGAYDDIDRAYVSEQKAASLTRQEVIAGDVLVAALGDARYPVGRACTYPEALPPAINKADCFRLRPNTELALGEFVMRGLNGDAARRQVRGFEQGVTMQRINLGNLRRVHLALPPIDEQRDACNRITAIDRLLQVNAEGLAKSKHQQSGLMDDLLTGRVRVTPLLAQAQATQP